jgi:hypothetical protein
MTEALATHVETPETPPTPPTAVAPAPTPTPPEPATPAAPPAAAAPIAPAPEAWRESLGDELKAHPVLEQFKGEDFVSVPRPLVRSYVEAQRFLGAEKTPMPQENWSEDDWAAHHNRLGRPETPEGYEFAAPEVPEGYPFSEESDQALSAALHKIGLSKAQAAEARSLYYGLGTSAFQAAAEAAEELAGQRDTDIRKEWGPNYAAKLQLANEAFHAYGGSPKEIDEIRQMKLADGTELGAHPLFLQTFSRIGETLKEHDILRGDAPTKDFTMSKDQAMAEYTKLEKRHFDMEKTDSEYQQVLGRMNQLAPIAFGGGKRSG